MILARILLQVWIVAFVGFFGSELPGAYPGIRVAAQVLFVAPLVVWAVLRLRGPRDRLDWAVLGALGALVIVSLASVDRQGALETVGLALGYALAFWAARDLATRPRLRRAAAVAVSYALVFWLVMTAIWWIAEKVGWIADFGTLPNLESHQVFIWGTANVIPVLALLAIPFLLAQPASIARTSLITLWALASVVTIPLSAGRAAWLGFLVAAIAYEGMSGWPRTRAVARWLRTRRLLLAAEAVTMVAGLGVLAVLLTRGQTLILDNLSDRFQIWTQALGIFAADPLTGGGPSTYSWLRLTHLPDYTFAVAVRLAHDVPVLTLADGGLVLFAGFATLLATFFVAGFRHRSNPWQRLTFAVLMGYGTASLLDDFSSLPAVMVLVVALAAWTVAAPPQKEPAPSRPRTKLLAPVAILVIGVLVLPSVIGVDTARTLAAAGRASAVDGAWPHAAAQFQSATQAYPTDAGYWLGLGLARWELGDSAGATNAYEEARRLSPGDPRPYGALAALTADPAQRVALLTQASKLTMTDPQYAFRLGDALMAQGRRADAVNAYALAITIDSELAGAFTGAGDATSRPPLVEIAPVAESTAAAVGDRDIYIHSEWVTWDIGLAEGTLPSGAGAAWNAVALASAGNLDAARAAADQAEQTDPFEVHTEDALLYVAVRACDRTTYDRLINAMGAYAPHRISGVAEVREHVYREASLGSYQPLSPWPLPPDQRWPTLLIGAPPACPGWSS